MHQQWRRFMKHFMVIGLMLMMQGGCTSQFPKLSKIKKKIPGLNKILQQDQAITTSLSDAVTDIPFLDDYNPQLTTPMTLLQRGTNGGLLLEFPGIFEFEAQSYCLRAGKYGPGGGDGYIYAPLKGPHSDIVRKILRNSVKHPEIPQYDIQVLLWAIISHTRIKDMSREMQIAAAKLLTPKEILRLEGSALGLTPQKILAKAFGKLPPLVRQTLEAEAKLREMLTKLSAPYEKIERVAVLVGQPLPGPGSRQVPSERWSFNPAGYFVRYLPSGYSQTTIQLHVPEQVTVERDEQERITLIEDAKGNRIETNYNDTIEPLMIPGDPGVQGYSFKSIRFVRHKIVLPETALKIESEWNNTGWTLVGNPSGKGRIKSTQNRFLNLKSRYKLAASHKKQLENLDEKLGLKSGIDDIMNLAHFVFALKEAVGSRAPMEQENLMKDHIDLVTRAWLSTFSTHASNSNPESSIFGEANGINGEGGINSSSLPEFDPSEGVAQPGNTGRQRLGQSGRESEECKATREKVKRELEETQRIKNAFDDQELLRRAAENDWDVDKYKNEVFKKVFGESATIDKDYVVPMYTNPLNCKIEENWNRERYRQEGYPDVIYDGDREHENFHRNNCLREPNPLKYNADMSFPHKLSREESGAYGVKIRKLQEWLSRDCK